jgi:hypothetical protein
MHYLVEDQLRRNFLIIGYTPLLFITFEENPHIFYGSARDSSNNPEESYLGHLHVDAIP